MNQSVASPQRKLAAIMFTDIAGYTAAMSSDEDTALKILQKKRSVLKPLINDHNGTLVKEIGDGTLSYFRSAIDAATCAVSLQQATYADADMNLRVGVHVGDIVFDDEDVFGDGVNVAARLESMAPVGGVCVSKSVFEELLNKKEFDGIPLGLQQLKGVGRLIDVFALKAKNLIHPDPKDYEENKVNPHADKEVPSLAILPLKNKGKEEDAFYAYGITADLITDLSRAGKIRVASMDDIEVEDAVNLSSGEAAKKLFVRYIVTGMLWKHGDMFQLSIEMNDTKENMIVWSDRWQEQWEELTTIKTRLTDSLLKALNLGSDVGKDTIHPNTEAYEYYLMAKYRYQKRQDIEDIEVARGLFERAIQLDDGLVQSKNELGWTYFNTGEYERAQALFREALNQTKKIGDKRGLGDSLISIGALLRVKHKNDEAFDYFKRGLDIFNELNDKNGIAKSLSRIGSVYRAKQDNDMAQQYFTQSLKIYEELGDLKGQGNLLDRVGQTYETNGHIDIALDYYKKSLEISEKLGDKSGTANSLDSIGGIYGMDIDSNFGDYDKALYYWHRSLELKKDLGDKPAIAFTLFFIGDIQAQKGEYDKALNHFIKSLELYEHLEDSLIMGILLYGIGGLYEAKGKYNEAMAYATRAIETTEKYGDSRWIGNAQVSMGNIHFQQENYNRAIEWFEKSLTTSQKVQSPKGGWELEAKTMLYLGYKKLGKECESNSILSLIKKAKHISYELYFHLYMLLGDKIYLENAHKQIEEKAADLEDTEKFLNYPIPKAIVQAWESIQ